MEPFFTTEHAGYSCELHYDEEPPSPADWDNLGTLVLSRSLARDWQPQGAETMDGTEEDAIERGGFALLYRYLRLTSAVVAAVPFRFEDYGSGAYRMYATDAYDDRMAGYIYTTAEQLRAWARRPGNSWPCSELARIEGELVVSFDSGGLYDLYEERPSVLPGTNYLPVDGIPPDELNAWSSDVLRETLPTNHPAYFVTVGQFEETT